MSAREPTTTPGPVEQLGPVAPRARRAGSRSCSAGRRAAVGAPARSSRSTSTRARSMWRRNWWPRPLPSLAPSMRPGMSATTNSSAVVEAHDAEVGLEGGERVVGDLGLGRRDPRDQRALAHVGEPDEGDVGHELELEAEPALLADLALLGEASAPAGGWTGTGRCPCRPGHRRRPASGRPSCTRSASTVAVAVVARRCPRARGPSRSSPPCAVLASCPEPWVPLVGPAVRVVAERQQRGHVAVGHQPDVAARCRRRRRRGRPWGRGPRAGTTRSRRRRRRPAR